MPQGQRAPQPGPQGPYRGPATGAGPPKPYQGQRQPVHARADVRGVPRQGPAPPQPQRGYQPATGGYGSSYGAWWGVLVQRVGCMHVWVAQGRQLGRARARGSQALHRLARLAGMVRRRVARRAMAWSTRGHTVGQEGAHRKGVIGGVMGEGRLGRIKSLSGKANVVDYTRRLFAKL